jgi:flavin-dependent dehydrogenase
VIPDVLILGGGPAGTAAGRLLAAWGHRVRLITKPESSGPSLAVSLPPSTAKLLALIGVQDTVDAAGFVRSSGNTVWWGGDARVEPFAGNQHGWQVSLDALGRVLLEEARASGVSIERRQVTEDEAAGSQAEIVLDCTGRAGLLARSRSGRKYDADRRTVALVGAWRCPHGWRVPDGSHTLIESYEDGWAWSVPTEPTLRHVAVMVDPRLSHLARGGSAADVYNVELEKTTRFRELVSDAVLEGGPWGWDASPYSSTSYAGDGWMAVGDAGSFIDPLSSAGAKKALASGWLAAVVSHTVINRPAMRETAVRFFQARETEMYAGFHRLTRHFLSEAASGHTHPFWSDRAEVDPMGAAGDPLVVADAGVRDAHEKIRTAPAISLKAAPGISISHRPAIGGTEIVLEPRLVGDGLPPSGLRYVRDVDLIALVELAPAMEQVPDLFDAYCRRAGPVALPDFLYALAFLVARGWLVWRERGAR